MKRPQVSVTASNVLDEILSWMLYVLGGTIAVMCLTKAISDNISNVHAFGFASSLVTVLALRVIYGCVFFAVHRDLTERASKAVTINMTSPLGD